MHFNAYYVFDAQFSYYRVMPTQLSTCAPL